MSNNFVAVAGLEAAPLADGGMVVYSAKSGKFIMLNRSADRLWTALQSTRTEDDLVRGLCKTYPGVDAGRARHDVRQALESLLSLDLVRAQPRAVDAEHATASAEGGDGGGTDVAGYASPAVEVLGEEDLLKVFQMTAAEISVAGCWWGNCRSINP